MALIHRQQATVARLLSTGALHLPKAPVPPGQGLTPAQKAPLVLPTHSRRR